MAIDVCTEISSAGISPRISFSHDLKEKDVVPIENYGGRLDSALLESSSDFDFCIGASFRQELSSADELFSDGKILPVEIKKKNLIAASKEKIHQQQPPVSTHSKPDQGTEKKRLKEFLSMSFDSDEKPPSKSFWQFKRSSSLNCDSNRGKSLIRSLQFLSRSNSTGSAPNQKQNLQKQASVSRRRSSVSSGSSSYYPYNCSSQKPPLKKNCGSYGNGVRISPVTPVLNLPHPYISRGTVNLFGFGSIFCNGKMNKKKK